MSLDDCGTSLSVVFFYLVHMNMFTTHGLQAAETAQIRSDISRSVAEFERFVRERQDGFILHYRLVLQSFIRRYGDLKLANDHLLAKLIDGDQDVWCRFVENAFNLVGAELMSMQDAQMLDSFMTEMCVRQPISGVEDTLQASFG